MLYAIFTKEIFRNYLKAVILQVKQKISSVFALNQ